MVNNKFFAIDAHCHIYPEKIAAKAVAGTDAFYGTVSHGSGIVENMVAEGEKAGIDCFLVQSVATTTKQVASINEFIAREVEKYDGKLTGLGTLHPDSADLRGDVAHLMSLGLHGVKLHPDIQNFKIDDYRCLKIYELCEENGLPILFHTGDSRYDNSNPNRLCPILDIYTGLTVVAAHFGGYSIWEEAAEKLKGRENLYVDCSSSFAFLPDDKIVKLIKTYGSDRVLFATDYPMWSAEAEVKRFLSFGFSDEDYTKMFAENAKKVYKL